ncbi:MAG: radical SAM protein [bacterium]|nr:radical SAM protein [bacterium]
MGNIYTKTKIFHYKDKLDSLPRDVETIKAPLHIRVKPTNVCNHNCRYCAYRAKDLQLGQDMRIRDFIPEERMMALVDDWAEMSVKAVTFSGGGDPFCYPYFLKTLQKLIQTPVRFATLTNGSLVKGDVAELFAQYGTWLRVSIDGWDDASYSRYRGVPEGEFTKVLQNMQAFKKMKGKCTLGASIVVDKENGPHIYSFIRRLKETGVDSVKVGPCIVANDGAENNRYHRPFFKMVKESVQKALADFQDDSFLVYDTYHELDEKFDKEYRWCPYLQILPVIGADMNVYSCQDKAYNLEDGLLGSIKDISFKEFWNTNKEKFFKLDPSRHCRHHCVANGKNKLVLEYLDADGEHLGFV